MNSKKMWMVNAAGTNILSMTVGRRHMPSRLWMSTGMANWIWSRASATWLTMDVTRVSVNPWESIGMNISRSTVGLNGSSTSSITVREPAEACRYLLWTLTETMIWTSWWQGNPGYTSLKIWPKAVEDQFFSGLNWRTCLCPDWP